jgi:predicted transcriptional regulator
VLQRSPTLTCSRLCGCGPCSVYALAKEVERNYSNVHTDVGKLEEHGLVKRTPEDTVFVPFESVEIHLGLFKRAA